MVGEGKNLLAQTDVLRVAHVWLTPDPGSCWIPEAAGKWDWRLGDVTRVHLCWQPWDGGTADRDPCLPVASLAAPSGRWQGALA